MRVQTFIELTNEYTKATRGLEVEDINERSILVGKYKYSVIVEGGCSELENLEIWMNQNIDEVPINQIWYGKTDYDFGFVEYFFTHEKNAKNFAKVVPQIYTTYPHAHPPGLICKSDGYGSNVLYNPENVSAIVFP